MLDKHYLTNLLHTLRGGLVAQISAQQGSLVPGGWMLKLYMLLAHAVSLIMSACLALLHRQAQQVLVEALVAWTKSCCCCYSNSRKSCSNCSGMKLQLWKTAPPDCHPERHPHQRQRRAQCPRCETLQPACLSQFTQARAQGPRLQNSKRHSGI